MVFIGCLQTTSTFYPQTLELKLRPRGVLIVYSTGRKYAFFCTFKENPLCKT